MVVAKAAGSFLGGIANNPGIIAIAAIAITLFIFRDRISEFFAGLKFPEFPEFPTIEFPEFPTIEFPEFPPPPDFSGFFDFLSGIFGNGNGNGIPGDLPLPPDVEDTGLLTPEQRAACNCGTNIIQDIMGDVSETCISPCPETSPPQDCFFTPAGVLICPEDFALPGGPPGPITNGFIGPPEPEPDFDEPEPPFEPPIDLPAGFEGGGPSFEGGTIFETDICNKSIGQIAIENGISASAAADMKAQACEDLSFFDFGTSTGSGFGPGDDPLTDPLVTGGATLESEEKKAACVSCELFGLNCPLCAGTI